MKLRGKNLDDTDVEDIVRVLDGWSGKLSWELLIKAVESRKFVRYTRQTLHKHERIARAFTARKQGIAQGGGDPNVDLPELRMALERAARLESENERLSRENRLLLEQFARWAYNAHSRGLSKDLLDRPLPRVNRDQSGNVSNVTHRLRSK